MKVVRSGPLRGNIKLSGDKSISHRAILLAAIAEGESRIQNLLVAGVTRKMLIALSELGVEWRLDGSNLIVTGRGLQGLRSPGKSLDCGNSATTMRMLAGVCSASGINVNLDGSPGLKTRPMSRIVKPLGDMGVIIMAQEPGKTAPLQIQGRRSDQPLKAIDYSSQISSAQVKSCLLLAGLATNGVIHYKEPRASRDHTERLLSRLGVNVDRTEVKDGSVQITMDPRDCLPLPPLITTIPGDISSAAFLIVAALITPDSEITIQEVGLNPTRTGLLEALLMMGADLEINNTGELINEPVGDITVRHSHLQGINLPESLVVKMIDEIPIFTTVAAYANGETFVSGAGELRVKETDRIAAIHMEFNKLGVNLKENNDGFSVQGRPTLLGGIVQSHGDHRMAMSLAVAGLGAETAVDIQNAEITAESYPNFESDLRDLGAQVE